MMGAAAFGLSLVACGDNVAETDDLNVDAQGNLYVTLRDVNGNVLNTSDSVAVTLLKVDKVPRYADSLGTVAYKDLQVGSYQVLLEKTGYASMVCPVTVGLAASDETPVAYDVTAPFTMHKLGASLSGNAVRKNYANVNGTEIVSAEGAVLRLELSEGSCALVNSVVSDTADASGNYSFANLPEKVNFTVKPQAVTVNDAIYTDANENGTTGVAGELLKIAQISYDLADDPFVITSTNINSVDIGDSVVVNFSKPVDVSRLRLDYIYVDNDVAINTAWSNSNKTLTVSSSTGKWLAGSSFRLYMDVYSLDGMDLATSYVSVSVLTEGSLGKIAGLALINNGVEDTNKVDAGTSTITLRWNALTNASGYEIYKRETADSAYKFLASTSDRLDTVASVSTSSYFDNGDSAKFFVVGVNTMGRSSFDSVTVLTLKDQIKPTAGTYPNFSWGAISGDYTATTDTTWLKTGTFEFSEDMDTTKAPVLTVSSAMTTKMGATYIWLSKTQLKVVLYAKKGVDLTAAATPVAYQLTASLGALTDIAGNTYEDLDVGTSYQFNFTN